MGLDRTAPGVPAPDGRALHERIEYLWQGVDGRHINGESGIFLPSHMVRGNSAASVRSRARTDKDMSAFEKEIDGSCF